jgi:hypothetical protein
MMRTIQSGLGWSMASVGMALLIASLVLSPATVVKADGGVSGCSDNGCESKCTQTLGCNRPICLCSPPTCICQPEVGTNFCDCPD